MKTTGKIHAVLRGPLWWSLFEEVWQVTARSLLPIQRGLDLNYEREGEECPRTSHWMETWSGFGGAGCLLILVCDKMTLNQTLGRIFKMLEAMSRQPCGPFASARCCCSDVRSLSQRAADNSYRQNCWWCERREIWKNRSVQLFVPCPCRLLVPLPGMRKLPKCSAYPYQWLPGVPKLTYAQTKSKKAQGAF